MNKFWPSFGLGNFGAIGPIKFGPGITNLSKGATTKGTALVRTLSQIENKEDTCWDIHGKSTDWKPRKSIKNRVYQVSADQTGTSKEMKNGEFNS